MEILLALCSHQLQKSFDIFQLLKRGSYGPRGTSDGMKATVMGQVHDASRTSRPEEWKTTSYSSSNFKVKKPYIIYDISLVLSFHFDLTI